MRQLELKIPPPVIFLIALAVIYFLPQGKSYPIPQWVGIVLALFGTLVGLAAVYFIRQARTTVNPFKPEQTVTLVTHGIYLYSRNPMYLSLVLVLAAVAIWLNRYYSTMVVIAVIMYFDRFQIEPEERILSKKFGQEFAEYQVKVRRWL